MHSLCFVYVGAVDGTHLDKHIQCDLSEIFLPKWHESILYHVDLTESCRVLDVRCLLCFTGQLHPDLSGSQRLVSMRLEWTPLTSFEALQAKAW